MRNFKDSRRQVNQMEKIRMTGRDLTEDLSVESRRKLTNELINDKHDACNLLLDFKKDLDLYVCKDGVDAKEVEDLKVVVEDVVRLRDILFSGKYGVRKLANFSPVRFLRIMFVLFGFILKCK